MARIANCFGYVGATLWLAVSSLVMFFLLAVYSPHIRSIFLPETVCTIQDSIYTTQIGCSCGSGCKSFYPCLMVRAQIGNSSVSQASWPVRLYLNDLKYIRLIKAKEEDRMECCIEVCEADSNANRDRVEMYRQQNALPGMTHKCHYDPLHITRGAFLERTIHWTLAFHVILWPGLSVIASILMCFYIRNERKRSCAKKVRTNRLQSQQTVEWDYKRSTFVYKKRKRDKESVEEV